MHDAPGALVGRIARERRGDGVAGEGEAALVRDVEAPTFPAAIEWVVMIAQAAEALERSKFAGRRADLQPPKAGDALVVLGAARLGKTRLIDNIEV